MPLRARPFLFDPHSASKACGMLSAALCALPPPLFLQLPVGSGNISFRAGLGISCGNGCRGDSLWYHMHSISHSWAQILMSAGVLVLC